MMKRVGFSLALLVLMVIGFSSIVSAQDNVELVLWHAWQDAEGEALLSMIEAFEASHPNITINQVYNPSGTIQDSFIAAAGAGEGPDAIIWANDSTGPWASAGLILDLTPYIDEELMAQAGETAWGTFTYNGTIYGIPQSAKTLVFFYNRSLVPDAPETWEEVLEISEELAADGITGLGFQNGFFHSAGFLYSLGGSLMDEDGNAAFSADSEGRSAAEAYLQFHQDMYNLGQDPVSGVVIDAASPLPGFQTGEVAMVYDGVWNLAQFEQDLGSDLGVALMPALDNGEIPALFAQTVGIYANANLADDEAKREAFLEFARFVTGEEGQQIAVEEAGHLPINPNVTVDDENLQIVAEQFQLGTPFPNRQELGAFWGPMGDAIAAVGAGGEDVVVALDTAYDLIQASIDVMHTAE